MNKWLSRSRGNGDTVCELPVVEKGRSLYPSINIFLYYIRTITVSIIIITEEGTFGGLGNQTFTIASSRPENNQK